MNTESSIVQSSRELLYVSFRAAWISTFNSLVCETAEQPTESSGFLAHIPWLTGTAPQVQLQCLFRTWQKLQSATADLTLLDQCVCHAANTELARLGELEHQRRLRDAVAGPRPYGEVDMLWIASKIRTMQITMPIRSAVRQQLTCDLSIHADLDQAPTTFSESNSELLNIVGAWRVAPSVWRESDDLLTSHEQDMLRLFLAEHPNLLKS